MRRPTVSRAERDRSTQPGQHAAIPTGAPRNRRKFGVGLRQERARSAPVRYRDAPARDCGVFLAPVPLRPVRLEVLGRVLEDVVGVLDGIPSITPKMLFVPNAPSITTAGTRRHGRCPVVVSDGG
jgi:hypothetical protein